MYVVDHASVLVFECNKLYLDVYSFYFVSHKMFLKLIQMTQWRKCKIDLLVFLEEIFHYKAFLNDFIMLLPKNYVEQF